MTRVVVDLGRLAELVSRMERLQAQLARAHDDVTAHLRQVHGHWTGPAAAAQAAAQAHWNSGAAEVQAGLAELRAVAVTAQANYAAAAQANRRMWSG
jgi:WXG100 family type VII secretion target